MRIKLFEFQKKVFPGTISSKRLTEFLKSKGIRIGRGTIFYDAGSITVDYTRPCLIEIGEYCKITGGVTILTHDYSRSVLRRKYGPIIGEGRKTVIGNNVFVGMKSIILMGSRIGNNVIIGAGSVVSGCIPDGTVVAGNPAKVIKNLEQYYESRKRQYVNEAFEYVTVFKEHYNRLPSIHEMDPFYPIFLERNLDKVKQNQLTIKLGGDNETEVIHYYMNSEPLFDGYDAFINEWKKSYQGNIK